MKNPFLDLINKERDEYVTAIPEVEDSILQEDYPTLGTLPDIGPKDPLEEIKKEEVASSVPALSEQNDLLASNNAAKAVEDAKAQLDLPKIDDDAESDKPNNKLSNFESLLQEYRANRDGRSRAIEAAAEQDRRTRLLNNLSKAMAQLNTGLASGYANIKVDPIDLGPADAEAKERAAQQGKLGELLTEYKLQKAIEPEKESDLEKLKKQKLQSDIKYIDERVSRMRGEGIYAKKEEKEDKKPTIFEKRLEEKAADDYIKTQQVAEDSVKQDAQLDDALQSQLKFSKDTVFGTGLLYSDLPFTDKSPFRGLSREAEQLDAKYKQLGLDKMVKMFSGMSKAVDSDAERLAFEKTTPSIKNDDATNTQIILGAKAINFRNKIEAKAQQKYLNEKGDLKGYTSPMMDTPTSVVVDKNGNFKLIPTKQLDLAQKSGFMTIDNYANSLIYSDK